MPWCEDCSKFWNPNSMPVEGTCPTCDAVIAKPSRGIPWHFKLMLVGLVLYLIYRAYWFANWLPKHI